MAKSDIVKRSITVQDVMNSIKGKHAECAPVHIRCGGCAYYHKLKAPFSGQCLYELASSSNTVGVGYNHKACVNFIQRSV
jgi:hypothetical protein